MTTISNFQTWKNDADMPTRDANGNWYDAETGIGYNPEQNYRDPVDTARAEKTKNARKTAKGLGGKALKGTAKQKVWAETLRKDALSRIPGELAERVLAEPRMQHAAWWIDNRGRLTPSGFEAAFRDIEIDKFQQPLRELLDALKYKIMLSERRGGGLPLTTRVTVANAEKLLASRSTETQAFSEMADAIIAELEAIG